MSDTQMQPPRIPRKWRPRLSLIIFLALATVLLLPLMGLFFFRIYENQLVHHTEAELIAQSAAFASVIKRDLETHLPSDVPLGAKVAQRSADQLAENYQPIVPSLDLAAQDLLPSRPVARTVGAAAHTAFVALGKSYTPDLIETQRMTLAGFRLLDPKGIVIAGRDEIGLSLAHVEEVADALQGRFRSVMRMRISKHEAPPIYSLSRGTGVRVFVAMPVVVRDQVAAVIYASRTPSNVFKHLYEERRKVVIATSAILVLTLLIGFIFHRTLTGPVHELIARTAEISKGNRSAIVPLRHHGTAEFAQLSQSFIDMASSLNNRSDFIATFAAHVSHELKSPLTSIQGAAELLRDDMREGEHAMSDEDRAKFLNNIIDDSQRLTAIVHRLRELARAENAPTSGSTTLQPVLANLRSTYENIDIRAAGDLEQSVCMSSENVTIILAHLIDNAARHGATGIELFAKAQDDHLCLTVTDNGSGISPNNRTKIFDSFFTTRRESGGTGMGLAIVRSMLNAHGGSIALQDCDTGTCFEITLPQTDRTL